MKEGATALANPLLIKRKEKMQCSCSSILTIVLIRHCDLWSSFIYNYIEIFLWTTLTSNKTNKCLNKWTKGVNIQIWTDNQTSGTVESVPAVPASSSGSRTDKFCDKNYDIKVQKLPDGIEVLGQTWHGKPDLFSISNRVHVRHCLSKDPCLQELGHSQVPHMDVPHPDPFGNDAQPRSASPPPQPPLAPIPPSPQILPVPLAPKQWYHHHHHNHQHH